MPALQINPGNIVYSEKRRKALDSYQNAVKKAMFLNENQKKKWMLLGYQMNYEQLKESEKLIINEDLRKLQERSRLEKIKNQLK